MKAYGYIRVSGAGQVDKDGPERQAAAIAAFCAEQRLPRSAVEFFERGVSGTIEGMDRPEFSRLIAQIEQDGGDACIVVERMDRIARDLMVQEFMLKECRERGIKVFAADQGQLIDMASDGGDPTRKLIRQVLGALAEWEKSVLVMKLRKARDRKRAENGHCEGPKPYGSTQAEREVVTKILRWEQYHSIGTIADFLNSDGHKTRSGIPWTRGAVRNVLQKQAKRKGDV